MKNQNYTNIASSSVKVIASEDLDLSYDFDEHKDTKSIAELLNDQKKDTEQKEL